MRLYHFTSELWKRGRQETSEKEDEVGFMSDRNLDPKISDPPHAALVIYSLQSMRTIHVYLLGCGPASYIQRCSPKIRDHHSELIAYPMYNVNFYICGIKIVFI